MDLSLIDELRERLARSGAGKPVLAGCLAVIVVAAVLAVGHVAGAAGAGGFEVEKAAPAADSGEPEREPTASSLFVHVSGAVERPGLYEVGQGGRVADAVDAAGGFSEDALTGSVNLARLLDDGEQIIVASRSDQAAVASSENGGVPGAASASSSGLVNINTAGAAELESLPGIGSATAEKVIADRQANGPFKSKDDLKRVSGIADKRYEAIADLICI